MFMLEVLSYLVSVFLIAFPIWILYLVFKVGVIHIIDKYKK